MIPRMRLRRDSSHKNCAMYFLWPSLRTVMMVRLDLVRLRHLGRWITAGSRRLSLKLFKTLLIWRTHLRISSWRGLEMRGMALGTFLPIALLAIRFAPENRTEH